MLETLLPRAHGKFVSMPLLGPIIDGFDDWLAANGYANNSRKIAIRMLSHLDANLRRRRIDGIANLTHATLHDCWRDLIQIFPTGAGAVRNLQRYLTVNSMIAVAGAEMATPVSTAMALSEEYANHLREVRGLAASTVSHYRYASRCFLNHLDTKKVSPESIQRSHVEMYINEIGQRLGRASLKNEIVALRGLLGFLATDGRVPAGLHRQIDTPRLYRLERLPRALSWDTVNALLRAIDTTSALGLRDYAIFLLIATYGLRSSDVVAITLDDIDWRQGSLRIYQSKTSRPLELPLTNEVSAAMVRHLQRTPPQAPHRQIFLRMRAPVGLLKRTAITAAFQSLVRKSGLSIPFQGPHCLRHSLAVHLLKNGTPPKTIGDILGHRTQESTSIYLRLSTSDLREVALEVPGNKQLAKVVRP